MPSVTLHRGDASILPLRNAVFCLDCETISTSHCDECPACKSRSLVSLARMLGGSLFAHRQQKSQESETDLFDMTITVELQQMFAKEMTAILERMTNVIAPKLARDQATFHVSVKPGMGKPKLQASLSFPERDAA